MPEGGFVIVGSKAVTKSLIMFMGALYKTDIVCQMKDLLAWMAAVCVRLLCLYAWPFDTLRYPQWLSVAGHIISHVEALSTRSHKRDIFREAFKSPLTYKTLDRHLRGDGNCHFSNTCHSCGETARLFYRKPPGLMMNSVWKEIIANELPMCHKCNIMKG